MEPKETENKNIMQKKILIKISAQLTEQMILVLQKEVWFAHKQVPTLLLVDSGFLEAVVVVINEGIVIHVYISMLIAKNFQVVYINLSMWDYSRK